MFLCGCSHTYSFHNQQVRRESSEATGTVGNDTTECSSIWHSDIVHLAAEVGVHLGGFVQGGHSHQGNDGGAVGVGNDAPLPISHPLHSFWVDFGDNKGDTISHSEG